MPNFRASSRVALLLDGNIIVPKITGLNFIGGVSVSDDGNGQGTVDINGSGGVGNQWIAAASFDFNDNGVIPVYTPLQNKEIVTVQIIIQTPFDNAGATAEVGITGDTDLFMQTSENDLTTNGEYETNPAEQLNAGQALNLLLTPSGSTQGSGIVLIQVAEITP